MKRAFDFCWSLVCLLLFSPLFLVCYIAIRLEDGGPAFFRQERIGKGGKPFNILKFRSMTTNGHRDEYALFKHEKNENLTRIGRFLRDHHLYYIDLIMEQDPRYERLYQLRPGVTSYATLHNGYTDTIEKMLIRLEMDLYYLEHQSLMLDAKILAQTFLYIAFGKKF